MKLWMRVCGANDDRGPEGWPVDVKSGDEWPGDGYQQMTHDSLSAYKMRHEFAYREWAAKKMLEQKAAPQPKKQAQTVAAVEKEAPAKKKAAK